MKKTNGWVDDNLCTVQEYVHLGSQCQSEKKCVLSGESLLYCSVVQLTVGLGFDDVSIAFEQSGTEYIQANR